MALQSRRQEERSEKEPKMYARVPNDEDECEAAAEEIVYYKKEYKRDECTQYTDEIRAANSKFIISLCVRVYFFGHKFR